MFKTISLEQIAKFIMGQSPSSRFVDENLNYMPFLQGCAEFGYKYPTPKVSCRYPKKICEQDDILVSVRAPVGTLNMADKAYCIGRGLAAVRFRENVDKNFGWHLLNYWIKELTTVSQGSTFEAVGKNELSSLMVSDIPFHEQHKIARILDTVDEAIQQTEQLIAKLKAIKQGLLHDLLTRGLDENGQLRDPITHPDQFKDSPLGKIPKVWTYGSLEKYVHFMPGFGFPIKLQGQQEGDFPFFKVSDMELVENYRYLNKANNYVSKNLATKRGWKPIPENSVVFAKVGAALLLNRRRITTCPSLLDNNMMAAVPQGEMTTGFLYYWMTVLDFGRLVQMTALPSVNQTQLGRVLIAFPEAGNEQARIISYLDSQDSLIESEMIGLRKLQAIKKGLMHDLLTGKVRVNIKTENLNQVKEGEL